MMIKEILYWGLSPLIGALIGFVTNVIAIRMLFRPLKEIRLFGIRLPFTPGILPRERHTLAVSIGSMVDRELLTPGIVRARIQREEFRLSLKASVASYTQELVSRPLGSFGAAENGTSALVRFAGRLVRELAASPLARKALEEITGSLIARNGTRSIGEMLGEEKIRGLEKGIENLVREGLGRDAPHISSRLTPVLDQAYEGLIRSVIAFLNQPEIHNELEIHGKTFLANAILKLNVFQRFFVSAAQYDRTLEERMPEIIGDLITQLDKLFTDEENRRRVIRFAGSRVESILKEKVSLDGLAKFFSSLPGRYLEEPVNLLIKRFTGNDIYVFGKKAIELLQDFLGKGDGTRFESMIQDFLEKNRDSSIAVLFSVQGSRKEKLDDFISGKILETADKKIDAILAGIQVKNMVIERIDSLDMLTVEKLVLSIMADKLKWIDLFGGILGFLIGVFQVVFSHFFG